MPNEAAYMFSRNQHRNRRRAHEPDALTTDPDVDLHEASQHYFTPEGRAEMAQLVAEGREILKVLEPWCERVYRFRTAVAMADGELPGTLIDAVCEDKAARDLEEVVYAVAGNGEAVADGEINTKSPSWWPKRDD
jgi:hypothetical protein